MVKHAADAVIETLTQEIENLKAEKISVLGEGECFVRKSNGGFVQSVKTLVHLYESKKEIYSLGNKWCISADGYDKLNQAAGLTVLAPRTISMLQPSNPHFSFDDEHNLKSVLVRRIVVGPSPIGNLVAIERLLRFDVGMYFLEDLQVKVKHRAGSGGYGTPSVKPDIFKDKTSVVMFPLGPAALWVDVSHPDIQEAFREHIKRCKYAERMATRMCERNAFASHPAIARRHVEPVGGVATVPVFGGRSIVDEERLKELTTAIEFDEIHDVKDVELVEATGVDEPELEEVVQVSEVDELSPNGETEESGESPALEKPTKTLPWKKAFSSLQEFKNENPGVYWETIEKEGIRDLTSLSTKQLNRLRKKLGA